MNRVARTLATGTVLTIGLVGLPSGVASAAVLAVESARCGSALVTAKLERDGRQREFDVEVYAGPRERWTVTVREPGGAVLQRISRTTNREGEFDAWRYLPTKPDAVDVSVQGPGGRCTIDLRA